MDELTKEVANFLKVLSDPYSIEIIRLLKNNELISKDIQDLLEISQSYTSQELKILRQAGIINTRKEGNIKYYYIQNKSIFKVLSTINSYILELHKEKYHRMVKSDNIDKLR
ncbi:MAG: ArsR/SmtB family transcription factor [Candidatus Thorarchaeota archaeon]